MEGSLCQKRGKYGEIPTLRVSRVALQVPEGTQDHATRRKMLLSGRPLGTRPHVQITDISMKHSANHRGVPSIVRLSALLLTHPLPPRHSFSGGPRTGGRVFACGHSSFTALKLRAKSSLIGNGELQIASYRFEAGRPHPNEESLRWPDMCQIHHMPRQNTDLFWLHAHSGPCSL